MEETCTTTPEPRSTIPGTRARSRRTALSRFISRSASHDSSDRCRVGIGPVAAPALLTSTSMVAELCATPTRLLALHAPDEALRTFLLLSVFRYHRRPRTGALHVDARDQCGSGQLARAGYAGTRTHVRGLRVFSGVITMVRPSSNRSSPNANSDSRSTSVFGSVSWVISGRSTASRAVPHCLLVIPVSSSAQCSTCAHKMAMNETAICRVRAGSGLHLRAGAQPVLAASRNRAESPAVRTTVGHRRLPPELVRWPRCSETMSWPVDERPGATQDRP